MIDGWPEEKLPVIYLSFDLLTIQSPTQKLRQVIRKDDAPILFPLKFEESWF
jgi:hypothetical protein